eukprot:2897756-Rhodomonas_salina.2
MAGGGQRQKDKLGSTWGAWNTPPAPPPLPDPAPPPPSSAPCASHPMLRPPTGWRGRRWEGESVMEGR